MQAEVEVQLLERVWWKKLQKKLPKAFAKTEIGDNLNELPEKKATNSSLEIEQRNMMRLTTN